MAAIAKAHFSGAGKIGTHADTDTSGLAACLRDVADDVAALKVAAPIADSTTAVTTADADATYGQPEADLINEIKADVNLMRTLLLDIRTKLAAQSGITIKTTKA